MSYQPAVYREQGGDKLIVASSGEVETQSGGVVDIQSGSSFTMATDMEVKSGGLVSFESGAYCSIESGAQVRMPVQSLGSSQVATNITNYGITYLTATTTAPAYTLAAPVVGTMKVISCETNTSSGTLVVNSNSTGVSFQSGGNNTLTMNAIDDAVTLVAATTARWIICGNVGSVGTGTQST